ncbi:MAG: hypothetical protein M3N32_01455 [Actinomycetota bacterium]|nr:hypothetical protein [Actinomycetota bacterium]
MKVVLRHGIAEDGRLWMYVVWLGELSIDVVDVVLLLVLIVGLDVRALSWAMRLVGGGRYTRKSHPGKTGSKLRTLWIADAPHRLPGPSWRVGALLLPFTWAWTRRTRVEEVASPGDPGIIVATVSAAVVQLVAAISIPSARFWP